MNCVLGNCNNEATVKHYLQSHAIVWVCSKHHNLLHLGLTLSKQAPVNVCVACGKVGICIYVTFASAWTCVECYKELKSLLGKGMDSRGGLKHSEAMKVFKEFCRSKIPKEKVIFT